ncbi:hypothetical protein FOZ60_000621 [Perkinsus olseni]|uniref:CCHC-type domain-containing protein n=1 Tax=Perkinsus olseni TaxID=32597 RepID=A0A7J6MYI7_PEROL|nr:hypothetical protein FOZ60_000621 [Perkinsus olseni]
MVSGDFPTTEKNVDEVATATFNQYKDMGASDEVAGMARDTARASAVAHNEAVRALREAGYDSGRGSAGSSARPTFPSSSGTAGSTVIQVMQTPMPERYDGVTDFEDWLRRYEADARGSGWTEPQMAERLGNYLRDVYFDVWHQHCTKKDFESDRLSLLAMFSPVRPDEILAKFNGMTWDRTTRVVAFLTSLHRCMNHYNKSLPYDRKLSAETMDQMVMDRLIANAPDAAKSVLRRRAPKTVKEICEIFEDYKEKFGPSTQLSRPAAASQADATKGSDDGMGPPSSMIRALVGSLEKLFDQQERRLAAAMHPKECFLCGGEHWLKDCPHKKFSEGCFVCGDKDHLARECSMLAALRGSINGKKSAGVSGNF